MKSRTAIAKVLKWSKDLRFFAHFLSLDLDLLWNFLVRRQGEDEAT